MLLNRIGPWLTLPLGMLAGAAGMAWLTRLTVTSSTALLYRPGRPDPADLATVPA